MKNSVTKMIFIFLLRDSIHISDKFLFKFLLTAYLPWYTVNKSCYFLVYDRIIEFI